MRQRLPVCLVLLVIAFAADARGASWESGSLEDALARAKQSGRWLLVDVYASWCGPCHEMDEKVWSRDEVTSALAREFVLLRRDGERDGEALVAKYHVVGYPTLLVLDGDGHEVDRLMGFVAPRELTTTLHELREGHGTLAEAEKKLAANPADPMLRLEVGMRHAVRVDARAVAELDEVVKQDPDDKGHRASTALLMLGKYYYLRGKKDYPQAERVLRELMRRFPQTPAGQEAPFQLGSALHFQGRDAEARQVLDAWLEAAPRDASRANAYAWLCFHDKFDRARGVEVARRGLESNPKDDGLWDTLAELESSLGRTDAARDAEKHALQLKPNDAYYEAQLKRFGGAR